MILLRLTDDFAWGAALPVLFMFPWDPRSFRSLECWSAISPLTGLPITKLMSAEIPSHKPHSASLLISKKPKVRLLIL